MVAQVRRITFNDEEIGMGFNSESGLAVGTALENFAVQEVPSAPGLGVSAANSIQLSALRPSRLPRSPSFPPRWKPK